MEDRYFENIETIIDESSDLIEEMIHADLKEIIIDLENGCQVKVDKETDSFVLSLLGSCEDMESPKVEVDDDKVETSLVVDIECDLSQEILDFIYSCFK